MKKDMWEENVAKIPECHCPNCGKRFDAATGLDGGKYPKENDITVCGYCATICVFKEGLSVSKMDEEEFVELDLPMRSMLKEAQQQILDFRKGTVH